MAARPLAGYRVLDLSRLLPGPWCTQLLADLGADVNRDRDADRRRSCARMAPEELGFGGLFASVNRGKRSVAVNYRVPRGREVVLRLARNADVFLESSKPGQMARRGLGPVGSCTWSTRASSTAPCPGTGRRDPIATDPATTSTTSRWPGSWGC